MQDFVDSATGAPDARGPYDLVARARRRLDFVDLTARLNRRIEAAGIDHGACIAFARHTTCALVVNEWERGALADFRRRVDALFPPGDYYEHDDLALRTENLVAEERRNGQAHVAQMLMGGTSLSIPIRSGRLLLGRWQRVILVELDRPKERLIAVELLGNPTQPGRARAQRSESQSVPRLIA